MIIRDNLILPMSDSNVFLMNLVTFRRMVLQAARGKVLLGMKDKPIIDYSAEERGIINYLEEEGQFLVESDLAQIETELEQEQTALFSEKKAVYAGLILTYACNARCIYCFQRKMPGITDRERVMTKGQVDGIGEFYEHYSDLLNLNGEYHFAITGGESLLPGTRSVLEYIFSKWPKARFGFLTNGVNLFEMVDGLPLAQIDNIVISLDGIEEIHNQRRPVPGVENPFDQIIRGIEKALTYGLQIELHITADRNSIWHVPKLLDYLDARGWLRHPAVKIGLSGVYNKEKGAMLDPSFNTPDEMMDIQSKLFATDKRLYTLGNSTFYGLHKLRFAMRRGINKPFIPRIYACTGLHGSNYHFDPYGKIYLCSEVAGRDEGCLGTYHPEIKLDEGKVKAFTNRYSLNLTRCRKCAFRFICSGGCPAIALGSTGNLMEPVCNYYGEEALLERIGEITL